MKMSTLSLLELQLVMLLQGIPGVLGEKARLLQLQILQFDRRVSSALPVHMPRHSTRQSRQWPRTYPRLPSRRVIGPRLVRRRRQHLVRSRRGGRRPTGAGERVQMDNSQLGSRAQRYFCRAPSRSHSFRWVPLSRI